MRQFRHLSASTIKEIYVGYLTEEPKLQIANRLQIDNATVHYHLRKIKHLTRNDVIALVAPKCGNGHTAFKCLVCGKGHDNIMSEEYQSIARLRRRVRELETQLSRYEKNSNDSGLIRAPIVRVIG